MRASKQVLFTLSLLLAASSVEAVDSVTHKASSQSVAAVWQKIGDFCGIGAWHPAVAKCELSADKKERTLTLKGGGTIVEHLVRWNDAGHSYTYRIVSGPLPVDHYVSTLRVVADKAGSGSIISWRGHYVAKGASDADAKKAIDGVYESGVAALAGP